MIGRAKVSVNTGGVLQEVPKPMTWSLKYINISTALYLTMDTWNARKLVAAPIKRYD